MKILVWIVARLKEPSTIAIIAGALAMVGFEVTEGTLSEIAIGAAALMGVVAAALKEKGNDNGSGTPE
tara:strand:+ start:665 stop:868 length:204 start_codon:yes stop_codon:yes gene_type:complete